MPMVKIQNLRAGPHGFGDDPRLQWRGGESKLIDTEWLKPFDNEPAEALFKGPNPAFRIVRPDETPEESMGLLSRLSMPVAVPKPPASVDMPIFRGESAPATIQTANAGAPPAGGPKTEAELIAAINASQAKQG